MSEEQCPGYYQDESGNWQPDRRQTPDRRNLGSALHQHERRSFFRRKADRELLEKDHQVMIREALDDFAAEHPTRPQSS
ncbi:MAG: hypothetical protein HY706_07405 [Candidatus Hydrogenedentes bacterium]|nr:hypothetical protein [Candidatus Hydrogenedentota bacterium]